jgi:DNA-binding CsgD family transcriptional regulator
MSSPHGKDAKLVAAFAADLADLTEPNEILPYVVPRLVKLTGADVGTSSRIDHARGTNDIGVWPPRSWDGADMSAYRQFMHQQPLIRHHRDTLRLAPLRSSDLITRSDYHRLDLYHHFYKPLGVEYQLALGIDGSPRSVAAIALSRQGADFSQRDMDIVTWLQPHLIGTWHNAREAQQQAHFADAVRTILEGDDGGCALLVVDGDCRVQLMAGSALPLADELGAIQLGSRVPQLLEAPARTALLRGSLTATVRIARSGAIRITARRTNRGGTVLILERRGARELELVGDLTPRQYQILVAVARHSADKTVARQLGISPRTVSRHLEAIYRKLGVQDRTAAVRLLLASGTDTARTLTA